MENKNLNEARRWLRQAKNDLEVANHDKKGGFYANARFIAQQSGEKALKSLCQLKGERQVIGHALFELLQRANKYYDVEVKKLEKECRRLDKYYIITRYPNDLPGGSVPAEYFDEEEAEKAIEFVLNILNWVEKKITEITDITGITGIR